MDLLYHCKKQLQCRNPNIPISSILDCSRSNHAGDGANEALDIAVSMRVLGCSVVSVVLMLSLVPISFQSSCNSEMNMGSRSLMILCELPNAV
jgi:hypothetical protein